MTLLDLEEMTLDQVAVLRGANSAKRRFITGSPQDLAFRGLIPPQPARSVAQMMADGMTEEEIFGTAKPASEKLTKRERRRQRLARKQKE